MFVGFQAAPGFRRTPGWSCRVLRPPRLQVRDHPDVAVRGLMMDAGRRYWQPDMLRTLLRELAWQHGNRLQLHLTEWNGFRVRLADPRFTACHGDHREPSGAALSRLRRRRPAQRRFGVHRLPTPSWTVDITRPGNRAWVKDLVAAFAAELDADAVHLGADEWPDEPDMAGCAALAEHARSIDPGYNATDAMVHFVDELAAIVRGQERRAEIWNGRSATSSSLPCIC